MDSYRNLIRTRCTRCRQNIEILAQFMLERLQNFHKLLQPEILFEILYLIWMFVKIAVTCYEVIGEG